MGEIGPTSEDGLTVGLGHGEDEIGSAECAFGDGATLMIGEIDTTKSHGFDGVHGGGTTWHGGDAGGLNDDGRAGG